MSRWMELLRDFVAAIAAFFRKSGAAEEKPRSADGGRLDDSELRRSLAAELQRLLAQQQEERKRERDALDRGRRDHLDSDW